MTWGQGYVWNIGVAFILFFLMRAVDKDYYNRKRTILKKLKNN